MSQRTFELLRIPGHGQKALEFAAAAAELVTGTDPAFVITGDLDQDLDEDLITVNEGLGAPAAAGAGSPMPPGPAVGSVNVSLNALVTPCPPDVNGDGVVNLINLLLCFGQPAVPGCSPEDVNGDGTVNVLDLIDLLLAFGTSCPLGKRSGRLCGPLVAAETVTLADRLAARGDPCQPRAGSVGGSAEGNPYSHMC